MREFFQFVVWEITVEIKNENDYCFHDGLSVKHLIYMLLFYSSRITKEIARMHVLHVTTVPNLLSFPIFKFSILRRNDGVKSLPIETAEI